MTQLVQIADRVLNRPLMILDDKLVLIASVLAGRIGIDAEGLRPESELAVPELTRHVGVFEQDPNSSAGAKKPYRTTPEGVAVIPIIGSLVNRGGWISALSGIASYENLKFQISAAARDDDVKSIILDIDSPGGEAIGAFETADAVREAALSKDVVAVATGLCCSAAYAIASAATRIITTKSSMVGSIGVVMLHADYSHKLHEAGVVPTLIHAGKKKVDGSPYKPLTDDVKASLKTEIEKFNSLFVATVAEGRKRLTPDSILAMEAGTYIGADAVAAGLADAVGSFESVLTDMSGRPALRLKPTKSRGTPMTTEDTVTRAELTAAVAAARTEATTAANAAHAVALTAAVADATKAGATAERERIKAITALEESKGREATALHLAMTTDMSAEQMKVALEGVPKTSAGRAGHNPAGLTFENAAPADHAAAASSWDKALAKRGMTVG